MMMNAFFPAMALMVLVGCSIPSPVQKAQRVKVDPLRSLNMEALCKDQAAKRYKSLFRILCKYLFSEVAVQAVTELDNKAAHCHTPVPQWHRPFL